MVSGIYLEKGNHWYGSLEGMSGPESPSLFFMTKWFEQLFSTQYSLPPAQEKMEPSDLVLKVWASLIKGLSLWRLSQWLKVDRHSHSSHTLQQNRMQKWKQLPHQLALFAWPSHVAELSVECAHFTMSCLLHGIWLLLGWAWAKAAWTLMTHLSVWASLEHILLFKQATKAGPYAQGRN